jgi:pSer/pThr/pTyr-binding forkhead associated (FHA) protein
MSKLIFSLDNAFLGDYPLDKERITIGRRPTNDIHIDNLAVSGEHAVVVTIGNGQPLWLRRRLQSLPSLAVYKC